MDIEKLKTLLEDVKAGAIDIETALFKMKSLPYEDLGFAKIDFHRHLRSGVPEVVFCQGKSIEQIIAIISRMAKENYNIIATRANSEIFEAVRNLPCATEYFPSARIIVVNKRDTEKIGLISVVSGGTADLPVADEAAVTAEILGNKVERIYDAGVAGLHRLLDHHERLLLSNVVIAVAGMEGALASVIGGLLDKPVIAVPTSIGYGASFGGLAALLTMLNSCAPNVSVVNIDNGFGAAYQANLINKLIENNKSK